ncbi:MAG: DUF5749 family beta-barrel protein [Thermoplasmatota archaeon]
MAQKKKGDLGDLDIQGFKDDHLSLHVREKNGKSRGETISFDGNSIIIKDGDDFLKVPFSKLEKKDEHIEVTKKVNWKKAKKEGERWRKDELDPL